MERGVAVNEHVVGDDVVAASADEGGHGDFVEEVVGDVGAAVHVVEVDADAAFLFSKPLMSCM